MNENQRVVIEWLSNSELSYMENLHELEGGFDESETIPDEVQVAYEKLSDVQKLEVVKTSATNLLKKSNA